VRIGLYARVLAHDQQMLPLQAPAMRDYVVKREWKYAVELQDVGLNNNAIHAVFASIGSIRRFLAQPVPRLR